LLLCYVVNTEQAMAKHPDWAIQHKRKGTELRFIKGNYYLYQVSSKWDPVKKKSRKITGKLLGKITEFEGFVVSDKERLRQGTPAFGQLEVKESGIAMLISKKLGKHIGLLEKHFPKLWQVILAFSYGRFAYVLPLHKISFFYQNSYLSELYPQTIINPDQIGETLKAIGKQREKIVSYFAEFYQQENYFVFEISHYKEYITNPFSKENINKSDTHLRYPIYFAISQSDATPIYYEFFPADQKNINHMDTWLHESPIPKAIIVTNNEKLSFGNLEQISNASRKYIAALDQENTLIDYSKILNDDSQVFDGSFVYRKKEIYYYTTKYAENQVMVFVDHELKSKQENAFFESEENLPEKLTMENYFPIKASFGTLALLTNSNIAPDEIYNAYKNYDEFLGKFCKLNSILEADKEHIQSPFAMEGWMFVNFVALQWHNCLKLLLNVNNPNSVISPDDALEVLNKVHKVKINQTWHDDKNSISVENLIATLGLND